MTNIIFKYKNILIWGVFFAAAFVLYVGEADAFVDLGVAFVDIGAGAEADFETSATGTETGPGDSCTGFFVVVSCCDFLVVGSCIPFFATGSCTGFLVGVAFLLLRDFLPGVGPPELCNQ